MTFATYRFYRTQTWPRRLAFLMQVGGRPAVDLAIRRRYPLPRSHRTIA